MSIIETHAHIYASQFDNDREEALERARDVGVEKILMPNMDASSVDRMLETEHRHPGYCIPMMGLHPCSVDQHFEKELYEVENWLSKRKFVAVGEIGMDLHWDDAFKEEQTEALKIQLGLAEQYKLPIVLHTRKATKEVIDVLKTTDFKGTGVFHCFGDGLDIAQEIVEMGFYLGIGGVSTFKNGGLDKVLPHVATKHLLLETDCPYLAPVPYRGKRNEPAYIAEVHQRVAHLQGKPLDEVAEVTTFNANQLFQLND